MIIGLVMGNYGSPPKFYTWFKQLILFLLAWFIVKVIVVLALNFIPIFGIIGGWILEPIKNDPRAQIVFVMFVFPLTMNILQVILFNKAWLIDRVIKSDVPTTFDDDETGLLSNVEDSDVIGPLVVSNDANEFGPRTIPPRKPRESVNSLSGLVASHTSGPAYTPTGSFSGLPR